MLLCSNAGNNSDDCTLISEDACVRLPAGFFGVAEIVLLFLVDVRWGWQQHC
jgi:hypothetical protein